jgi:hypothetical protein
VTPEESRRLFNLAALDANDHLWEAVRLCDFLKRHEPDPLPFSTIQAILEEIGHIAESGPVDAGLWERVRAQLVPAMRQVIEAPSSRDRLAALSRCWARLKQEEPPR